MAGHGASLLESSTFIFGASAEETFAAELARRGHCVLPTCKLAEMVEQTKAPMLITPSDGLLVMPDLLCFRNGEAKWVEVKGKTKPSPRQYHPGPRWEHGMDFILVEEYRRIQELTRMRVYIVIYEDESPENLDDITSRLVPSAEWRMITIREALRVGDRRPDWPGGKDNPNNRGRGGLGGWLWPARDMMTALEEVSP